MAPLTNGDALAHGGMMLGVPTPADFFSKLSRLEGAVLTGHHPKFKFSNTDAYKLADTAQLSLARQLNAAVHSATKVTTNGVRLPDPVPKPVRHPVHPSVAPVNLPPPPSVASEPKSSQQPVVQFNPALLTKSEDLVRAELNLQRQRVEKKLRESERAKEDYYYDKDSCTLSGPNRLDPSEILKKAFAIVPPFPGVQPEDNHDGKSASSFGDGYYSSRGNSWSPDHSVLAPPAVVPDPSLLSARSELATVNTQLMLEQPASDSPRARVSGLGPKSPALPQPIDEVIQVESQAVDLSESSAENAQTDQPDSGISREESYSPPAADALGGWVSTTARSPPVDHTPQSSQFFMTSANSSGTDGRTRESESYSPPPAATPPNMHLPAMTTHSNEPSLTLSAGNRSSGIYGIQEGKSNSASKKKSSRAEVRKMRREQKTNEKQAKRVSKQRLKQQRAPPPKIPNEAQKESDHSTLSNQQHVQSVATQPADNKRKRRREEDALDEDPAPYRPFHSATLAISPQRPIKTEPRSPPSFANGQAAEPPRRLVFREDGRADIEILETREALSRAARAPVPVSLPAHRQQAKYIDPNPIWIDDPEPQRPVIRHNIASPSTALRRAATLRHALHPAYATDPLPYPEDDLQYIRPQPQSDDYIPLSRVHPRHADIASRPLARYSIDVQDDSLFQQDDEYIPVRQSMPPPPPPKRRIFVDEDGNEFIAIPAKSILRSSVGAEEHQYNRPTSPYVRQDYREPLMSGGPSPLSRQLARSRLAEAQAPIRAQSYALEEPLPVRGLVSPTDVAHRRAQSHAIEYQKPARTLKRPAELVEDEDDYRRLPPPPPRAIVRQRPVETADEPLFMTNSHQERRAVSMQPGLPTSSRGWPLPGLKSGNEWEGVEDMEYVGTPGVDGRWVRLS